MRKCVVVEDEYLIGCFIKKTLEANGYHVISIVDSQEEAISSILMHRPDFVIIDKNINHNGCGIKVVEQCKKKLNIPYLFITGSSYECIQTIAQMGFKLLVKPFDAHDLLAFLESNMTLGKDCELADEATIEKIEK